MPTPTDVELILNNGLKDESGSRLPAFDFSVFTVLKARNAYDMRLGLETPPSGNWEPYNCQFYYDFVGPSGGSYTLYAQVRDISGDASSVVSDTVVIWGIENKIPMSLMVDSAVYYYLSDVLTSAGFVDISGNLDINLIQEQLEYNIPEEVSEKIYGGEQVSSDSIGIPAVAITSMVNRLDAGALGGANWESQFYHVDVYGSSEQQSKEISAILQEKIPYGIPVYDYNMGFPGISGFPLPNQLLGVFPTRKIQCNKVLLPSYSPINLNRRKLTFEVFNMRKTY